MSRPKIEITPEITESVEEMASKGLTQEQIAHCLGWAPSTLYEKKKVYKEFSEAIQRGKSTGIRLVSNALFESAMQGNFQSQQFYLKNRDNENWNDRKHLDINAEVTHLTPEEWLDALE